MSARSPDVPTLPSAIEVLDQWPESVRYILPRRSLGHGKWFGLALMVVGVVVMASVVLCISTMLAGWPKFRNPCTMLLAFFIAPMTWGGLAPFWWGLSMFFGHRELDLRDGKLRTIERVGPLWRSKRWAVESLRSLEVKPVSSQGRPPPSDILAPFNALVLHTGAGKQGMLAWGYPFELLAPLAHEVAQRCDKAIQLKSGEAASPIGVIVPGEVRPWARATDGTDDDRPDDDLDDDEDDYVAPALPKPAESPIEIEHFEGHDLTVQVPPAGIWKGSGGLFAFGLVWCGFMTVFDGVAVVSMLQNKGQGDNIWGLLGVSSLFWLVGILMLVTAINLGRRKAALAFAGGQLMAIQTGIFGSKRREWLVEEVDRICPGPSGVEVNDRPVLELQIHGRDNSKFGLLSGRTEDELHWLAQELSTALQAHRRASLPIAEGEPPTS